MPRPRGEDDLTAWLRDRLGPGNLLGNDAAVLPELPPGARLVATVDSQIAGVHHPAGLDPALAARRLLAVNVSDAAAMGADPAWALLALSGPPELDRRRYFEGLLEACDELGVTLAGGDLAGMRETSVGSLTLLCVLPAGRAPLERSAARPGQALWVAGTLGESALGQRLVAAGASLEAGERSGRGAGPPRTVVLPPALGLPPDLADAVRSAVRRHLDPASHLAPQLRLGRTLALRPAPATAALDLSDGLAADLPRLLRASAGGGNGGGAGPDAGAGLGAEIDADALPTAPGHRELCRHLDVDPLELALGGGEDYVLLFTLPPDARLAIPGGGDAGADGPLPRCTRIGRIVESPGLRLLRGGREVPLDVEGWDHLR